MRQKRLFGGILMRNSVWNWFQIWIWQTNCVWIWNRRLIWPGLLKMGGIVISSVIFETYLKLRQHSTFRIRFNNRINDFGALVILREAVGVYDFQIVRWFSIHDPFTWIVYDRKPKWCITGALHSEHKFSVSYFSKWLSTWMGAWKISQGQQHHSVPILVIFRHLKKCRKI